MGADFQMNTQFSAGIQAMLPMLYAAWADRHLNLKEINALRKRANDLPFLTDGDKKILLAWSDPARPPEREVFQQWQTLGRNAADKLPADVRPASPNSVSSSATPPKEVTPTARNSGPLRSRPLPKLSSAWAKSPKPPTGAYSPATTNVKNYAKPSKIPP